MGAIGFDHTGRNNRKSNSISIGGAGRGRGVTMQTVSTIVISRNQLFREGLRGLLSKSSFEVVWTGADAAGAGTTLKDRPPMLGLVGVSGDQGNGADILRRLRLAHPECRAVALASRSSHAHFTACLAAGADGYLLTEVSPDVLLDSLRLVMLGEKVFPSVLATWLLEQRCPAPQAASGVMVGGRSLSPRELQILALLSAGETNKRIACQLQIADATVKLHLRKLLRKIGATNRTQAAIWAMHHKPRPDTAVDEMPALRRAG
jgi:two-component system, NarL family, nitrate/nitrite response regulator NarL